MIAVCRPTLDSMLRVAPIHIARRDRGYVCTWSIAAEGNFLHATGQSEEPYSAIARAWEFAHANGWVVRP